MQVRVAEFEGPLDLLLLLIRKNEYDIRNLPIAEVTRQYLDFLKGSTDLNLTADFAYMAATLIQIKSRTLLPMDPEIAARSRPDDEKDDLIRQLLMRDDQMRGATEFLKQKLELTGASWSRSLDEETLHCPTPPAGTLNLVEIMKLAKRAFEQARMQQQWNPGERGVTVAEMIRFIELSLQRDRCCELLDRQPSENQPTLFLALLELAKADRIRLRQHEAFGPVLVEAVV